MNEYEKRYQYCMPCKYSHRLKEDADGIYIYCLAPKGYCPHKKEIEDAERKEE